MSTNYPSSAWNWDYYGEGTNILVDRWANVKGFTFNSAQTAGAVVKISAAGIVDTPGTDDIAQFGVVMETTASGAHGPVVVEGIVRGVTASGAISAGQKLHTAAVPAGSVYHPTTPTAGEIVGTAVTAASATGQLIAMYVGK